MDKAHFTELPEAPTRGDDSIGDRFSPRIEYLDGLEDLANTLHKQLLMVQADEAKARNEYSKKLESFAQAGRDRRAMKDESEAHKNYDEAMKKMVGRRGYYRELLWKVQKERKRFLESIRVQKAEDAYIAKKIDQLNSLDADSPERTPRWDPFGIFFIFFLILTIVVYVVATTYSDYHDALNNGTENRIADYFTFFWHISMFVLPGVAMTYVYMRKYAFSALGFSLLAGVWAFQWAILNRILWDNIDENRSNGNGWSRGHLTIWHMINAMYGTATVVISFGAYIGHVGPLALMFVAFGEIGWYVFNYFLVSSLVHAVDYAGPMSIHLFAAVFGVSCGTVLNLPFFNKGKNIPFRRDRMPSYNSNTFALIGTLIMFVTFPSFNAALAPDLAQFRVAINTIVATVTSVLFAFIASRTFWGGKFHMLEIQHATLAGGVAIGAATAECVTPGGAAVVGAAAGLVSSVGYAFLVPYGERHFGLLDETGILAGHGLPGLLGGVAGILSTAIATGHSHIFGQDPEFLFREGTQQPGHQAACLAITFGIALGGGLLTGFVVWLGNMALQRIAPRMKMHTYYSDDPYWLVPGDFERTLLGNADAETEGHKLHEMH